MDLAVKSPGKADRPAFRSFSPMQMPAKPGREIDELFLSSRIWKGLATVKPRYREKLGEIGMRRCWQLTWLTPSALATLVPALPNRFDELLLHILADKGTYLGARLVPTSNSAQNMRLARLLKGAPAGNYAGYIEEILPLVLERE